MYEVGPGVSHHKCVSRVLQVLLLCWWIVTCYLLHQQKPFGFILLTSLFVCNLIKSQLYHIFYCWANTFIGVTSSVVVSVGPGMDPEAECG